jgi:hypothetical protein
MAAELATKPHPSSPPSLSLCKRRQSPAQARRQHPAAPRSFFYPAAPPIAAAAITTDEARPSFRFSSHRPPPIPLTPLLGLHERYEALASLLGVNPHPQRHHPTSPLVFRATVGPRLPWTRPRGHRRAGGVGSRATPPARSSSRYSSLRGQPR